jgi:hypothetical protein
MPTIKDGDDLNLYLKVIAEESVRNAYTAEKIDSSLREAFLLEAPEDEEGEDDPLFGGGDGDEEDLDAAADKGGDGDGDGDEGMFGGDGEGDEGGGEEFAAEPEEPKKEKVQIRPTPLTLELGQVSTDGLISTLNMIRAGRSFKEADVADQLKQYMEDQLNDNERLALATFLSAIRDISGGETAKDAPEPGDENIKIDVTDRERDEEQAGPTDVEQRAAQVPAPRRRTSVRDLEDTTPPITVGRRNEAKIREYREHVQKILQE